VPCSRHPAATTAASYSRYSTDLQQAASIADQQRKCRDHAAKLRLTVPPGLEFSDEAVSGTKLARDGLDRLLAAARAGRFGVLVVENLSRLARESVITLPLLKELVELRGVRVVSVDEGIDTERPGWELPAVVFSLSHERFVKDLSRYVLRGQEGVVLAGHSVGDYCFGYRSVPVPGSEAGRRGRDPKPRMRYVIDPEQADWVRRIFRWFAEEKRSVNWIARELTRLGAPKDHRATTTAWYPQYVRRVLGNPKYVGRWPWGLRRNRRDPFTGKVRQDERDPAECARWVRDLPELRIIDEGLWDATQRRLEEVGAPHQGRRRDGRLTGRAAGEVNHSPRHLLAGLLACSRCGSTFQVCGNNGKNLGCRGYRTGACVCRTQVPRARAERLIVRAISERVLADPRWRDAVLVVMRAEHRAVDEQLPGRLAEARKRLAEVRAKAGRLLDALEDGSAPPDVKGRLEQRLAEQHALEREVAGLERAESARPPEPTGAWVDERLRALEGVLGEGGPAAALAVRALVGGRIVVEEVGRPGRKRNFVRARFTVRAAAVITGLGVASAGAGGEAADTGWSEEITIDIREPAPWERKVDEIKVLWDQGLLNEEIAARLGCNRNQVTKALNFWHEQRGLEPPDGRRRWRQLDRSAPPPDRGDPP
jgi:DNA invertase Pin-like site-specific DNA recombinase